MAKADMYLTVEGKKTGVIRGESSVAEHLGEIEVRSWSWGMKGSSTLGGAGSGVKSALSELHVTKGVDCASTALMSVMRNNEAIKKAVLSVRKAGSVPSIDYLTIKIENGRIASFDFGNEGNDSPTLVEHLTFTFEKIEITYAAQDNRGAKTAGSTFQAITNTA
jgi:type VI secretion system secreted protein Hcp